VWKKLQEQLLIETNKGNTIVVIAMSNEKEKADATDDYTLSTGAFEALEREYQDVMRDLMQDDSLEKFKIEYEKLHRTLLKSHENEKRLMKKCAELNAEIVANAQKVQTALKLSTEDQNTIFQLKKEIEKAWKLVEASHDKEAKAKETIASLTKEISVLSKLVDHGAGLSAGHESTVNELLKAKEELQREREQQQAQILTLLNECNSLQNNVRKLMDDLLKLSSKHLLFPHR